MQRSLALRSKFPLQSNLCPLSTRTTRYLSYALGASLPTRQTSEETLQLQLLLNPPTRKFTSTSHQYAAVRRTGQTSRASKITHRGEGRGSRKAKQPGEKLSSRSRGPEAEELAAIVQSLDLPTKKDVPNLPADILTFPAYSMQMPVRAMGNFDENASRHPSGYKYTLSVDDPIIGSISVSGIASSKGVARSTAYLRFLAEAHKIGTAASIFPISNATIDKERQAMLDVYLFAARYQDIPQVSLKKVSQGGTQSNIVEIILPLMGVQVAAKGKSRLIAEVSAALKAKSAIEKRVEEGVLVAQRIQDDQVFGLASSVAFLQWYKYQNRGIQIDVNTSTTPTGLTTANVVMNEDAGGKKTEYEAATSNSKKSAEDLASLIAAITITRADPQLRARFLKEYLRNNYQVLPPVHPVTLEITEETEDAMHEAIRRSHNALQQLGEEDDIERQDRSRPTIYRPLSSLSHDRKCEELTRRLKAYESRDDLAKLRKTRSEYPMNQYTQQVLQTVKSNVYSIIIGATGSGKTTQVPQILFNDAVKNGNGASCNIICTQPRRIAAKSVSQRVADERAEFLGDCVGYHVKGDARLPSYGGSINFCTTGILTQQLQHHADEILENASHLIIDEVHERDTIIDFLLTNLRRLIKDRLAAGKKVPHVILMSATIDPDLFSDYLKIETQSKEVLPCPSLSVPGRTFPVREAYLDEIIRELQKTQSSAIYDPDSTKFIASEEAFSMANKGTKVIDDSHGSGQTINWVAERQRATAKAPGQVEEQEQAMVPHALVAGTIGHIVKTTTDGAILTFLPGLEDITKVNELLQLKPEKGLDFTDESKYKIFMLHSSIQDAQREVFNPVPDGCRKIILATNIAETSITIPDVQHVVDTGKLRELQYDQTRRITKLACVWVSKSNAKQRAGRAGRVQDGNYYALYTKERYNSLRAVGLPELLRSDLQEICLGIKNQGYDVPIKEFLAEAIEPPSMDSVEIAISNLISLQALNKDETMTSLGKLLAQLPVHPSLGKMIVLGMVFRCLDPMLIIGASFAERNIFVQPLEKRKEAKEKKDGFARNTLSDHIGLLAAVKEMRMLSEVRGGRAMFDFAGRNFLHAGAFKSILSTAEQIENLLVEQRVISRTAKIDRSHFQFGDPRLNENSDKVGLIKALILAGFHPNLGARRGRIVYRTPQEATALVHPSSVNGTKLAKTKSRSERPPPVDSRTDLLAFSEQVRSSDGNNMYLRETTPVTPLVSALFSGSLEQGQSRNILEMDGWLPFYLTKAHNVRSLLKLHGMLQAVTTAAFNDLAVRRSLTDHEDRNRFADAIVQVLDYDLAHSAVQGSRASAESPKRHPSSAFATDRRGSQGSRAVAPSSTSQDTKRQELWDDLISSWAQKQKGGVTTGQEAPRRSSAAALFAQGHADLKSSSSSNARARDS